MAAITLFMVAIALVVGGAFQAKPESSALYEADAVAANYVIYRQAVIEFYETNPTASGTINDASLPLPIAYRKIEPWTNRRGNATAPIYIYGPNNSNAGYQVVRRLDHPINTGVELSDRLWSPIRGDLNQPVPNFIPDGSLVTVFNR